MKPVHFCTGFIFCSFPVVVCTPLKMSVKIQGNATFTLCRGSHGSNGS